MKRLLSAGCLLLVVAVVLGMTVPMLAQEKQKLVIMGTQPTLARDAAGAWLDDFARLHNVEIEYHVVPWGSEVEQIVLAVVSGQAPDVVIFDQGWEELAHAGILADLNEFIQDDPGFPADELLWPNLQSRQGINGEQWAFPINVDVTVLFYNTTLFDQRGIAVPDADMDWDGWLAAGMKLTWDQDGDGTNDHLALTDWNIPWAWQSMLLANDAQLFTEDGMPSFGGPEAREVYQFWRQWYQNDLIATGGNLPPTGFSTGREAFIGGRVGMNIIPPWFAKPLMDAGANFEWNISLMPTLPTGKRPSEIKGTSIAVVKGGPNEELAYELAKYPLTYEAASTIARGATQIVTNLRAARDHSLTNIPGFNRDVALEAGMHAEQWPKGVFWDAIAAAYRSQMNAYFNGSVDMNTAILNAEIAVFAQMEDILRR